MAAGMLSGWGCVSGGGGERTEPDRGGDAQAGAADAPESNRADRFDDPTRAFWWADQMFGMLEAPRDAVWFADWQMIHARWDHDDDSRYGQPLFASATGPFKRMTAGEVDIAIRRKTRAGMKYVHVLEGARRGRVDEVQGAEQGRAERSVRSSGRFLHEQGGRDLGGAGRCAAAGDRRRGAPDHSWWMASPVPMSLVGYGQDLNRDVLEKQKEQYDEELDPISQWVEDEILVPLLERDVAAGGDLAGRVGVRDRVERQAKA